ncbi:phage tail protein [Photorhabdus akhurstii]|uniref:phage tail protein n=1 Tax=Photorhabdus akhurstii TaxID=171438 RepID=UPI001BD26DE8|nr:phage tail protein [Photorhabdus akhurstii]MBS9427016.1 phage tail protein [Photorhabdus akhurstii]
MSPKNDFKSFSIGNNANIVSQGEYEQSPNLKTGFPPDNITVHLLNKVLRQSSAIASVVANFIATYSGNDVLDDGDIVKLAAQLNSALEQKIATEVPNASLTQKGVTQLTDKTGNSNTLAVTQKLVSDVNDNANNRLAKDQNGADIPDKKAFVENLNLEVISTKPVVVGTNTASTIDNFDNIPQNSTYFGYPVGLNGPGIHGPGMRFSGGYGTFKAYELMIHSSYLPKSELYYRTHNGDGNINKWNPWYKVWSTSNAKPDTNGNLKVSSPVVDIHPDGTYQLTREAEGVTVERIETGKYRISGCNGFAKDGEWGIHGGTIVPADSNGLNLIWVCESVDPSSGDITIECYHRQNRDAPIFAQNKRVKSINGDGEVIYYHDGELCDIPDGRVINVRVQLPEKPQE